MPQANLLLYSLTLPPMDASARKIIHELANKFNIKSKSAGHGETRRPSLYRTKRTVRYSEPSFEQVFARAGRRYFPRLDQKGKAPRGGGGGGGGGMGRSGRGINHAAFTLKDGEVVGGGAPELDQANKGRAMLEKMGWSTGMALGTQVCLWESTSWTTAVTNSFVFAGEQGYSSTARLSKWCHVYFPSYVVETARATGGSLEYHIRTGLSVPQRRTNSWRRDVANSKHLGRQAYEGWSGLIGAPSLTGSHLHRTSVGRVGSGHAWSLERGGATMVF